MELLVSWYVALILNFSSFCVLILFFKILYLEKYRVDNFLKVLLQDMKITLFGNITYTSKNK